MIFKKAEAMTYLNTFDTHLTFFVCFSESHPGMWEVPMKTLQDVR